MNFMERIPSTGFGIRLVIALISLGIVHADPALLTTGLKDFTTGQGIPGVTCKLYNGTARHWDLLQSTVTAGNFGNCNYTLDASQFGRGNYRVVFYSKEYYDALNTTTFYPYVEVAFIKPETTNVQYLVNIMVTPYSYVTYKGWLA